MSAQSHSLQTADKENAAFNNQEVAEEVHIDRYGHPFLCVRDLAGWRRIDIEIGEPMPADTAPDSSNV